MATTRAGLRRIDPAAVRALVDTMVDDELVPGAVVLLRTPHGELTAAAGTTERGLDRRPGIDTHFRIASNTKTMTAAVVLQLAAEGKLRLDDPVSREVAGVPNGDHITISQLLSMRSGLYNYTNRRGSRRRSTTTRPRCGRRRSSCRSPSPNRRAPHPAPSTSTATPTTSCSV